MEIQELSRRVEWLSKVVNYLVQGLPEDKVFAFSEAISEWRVGVHYGGEGEDKYVSIRSNSRLALSSKVYKCVTPHTSQADWPPDTTPSLWVYVDRSHAGTLDDPIPAQRSMEYVYGKYYLDPEDEKIYLCKRIGEPAGGTIILHYLPHELIGHSFEEV